MLSPRPALKALRRLKLRGDARWQMPVPAWAATGAPLDIAIVGAGVSGLVAGRLLRALGHRVSLFEARSRPGGRIRTLRDFDDGLWADAGAVRIADTHLLTHYWARQLGLRLEPVYPHAGRVMVETPAGWALRDDARWLSDHRLHRILTSPPPSEAVSALTVTRRLLHEGLAQPAWTRIAGGMDRLPDALARSLGEHIRYASPVQAVDQCGARVRVQHSGPGERVQYFDRAVMAVPHTVLGDIQFEPALGPDKRHVADTVPNADSVRIVFQLRDREWMARSACGYGVTCEGAELWQPSFGQRTHRSLLVFSAQGRAAQPLLEREPAARASYACERAEAAFPGIGARIEHTAQVCWSEDPWARGAQSRVDQAGIDRRALAAPEGRIHFAGEYTSNNWIDGALQSAHRVVDEIVRADPAWADGRTPVAPAA